MTAPLITVEDVAALLPIRPGNTSQNAKLIMLINAASAQIEQAISRELDKKQRVQYFDAPNTYRAYYDFSDQENTAGYYISPRTVRFTLTSLNIDSTQLLEVRYDPTGVFDSTTILVNTPPASYYAFDNVRGILRLSYPMWESAQSIMVTYTGGYAVGPEGDLSASIPYDIKMACLAQVMHMFNKFTTDNIGKLADTTEGHKGAGGSAFANKMGLVPEALALLTKYKAIGMGIY